MPTFNNSLLENHRIPVLYRLSRFYDANCEMFPICGYDTQRYGIEPFDFMFISKESIFPFNRGNKYSLKRKKTKSFRHILNDDLFDSISNRRDQETEESHTYEEEA